jgi:surface antigen
MKSILIRAALGLPLSFFPQISYAQGWGWNNGGAMSWENQRDIQLAERLGYRNLNAFRSDQAEARRAQDEALRRDTLNRPVEWFNRQTGNRGRSSIVQMGRDRMGNACRVMEEELLVNGRLTRQSGMVCHDGRRWVAVR